MQYYSSENNWPGVRTKPLNEVNPKLFAYLGTKIFLLFHDQLPQHYTLYMGFQKIKPFIEGDKWNRKNRGWVHKDFCLFGGIVYLDKNHDKDAQFWTDMLYFGMKITTRGDFGPHAKIS